MRLVTFRISLLGLIASAGLACASAPANDSPPPPVYQSEAEIPCSFETAGTVTAMVTAFRDGVDDFSERAIAELADAGKRKGVDAVVYDPDAKSDAKVPFVVTRLPAGSGRPLPGTSAGPEIRVTGVGIRFLDQPCGRSRDADVRSPG